MSHTSGGIGRSTVILAGWLFADLAVGLVIILLATATDMPPPAPAAALPSPNASPTAAPSPTPAPEPALQRGMEDEPVVFRVRSDAGALLRGEKGEVRRVADAIRKQLRPYEKANRKVGFVLTWGASRDASEGVALARVANELLHDAVPDLVEGAAVRDLWSGSREYERGTLIFEIFMFVEG